MERIVPPVNERMRSLPRLVKRSALDLSARHIIMFYIVPPHNHSFVVQFLSLSLSLSLSCSLGGAQVPRPPLPALPQRHQEAPEQVHRLGRVQIVVPRHQRLLVPELPGPAGVGRRGAAAGRHGRLLPGSVLLLLLRRRRRRRWWRWWPRRCWQPRCRRRQHCPDLVSSQRDLILAFGIDTVQYKTKYYIQTTTWRAITPTNEWRRSVFIT